MDSMYVDSVVLVHSEVELVLVSVVFMMFIIFMSMLL
jgi:hypothetical protein